MKVLYDQQIFCYQSQGGISRYFNELIDVLSVKDDIIPLVRPRGNDFDAGSNRSGNPMKDTIQKMHVKFREKRRARSLKDNEQHIIESLKAGDYDIFHPTYYNPYFLKYLKNKPFVLTIYDMIYEIYPEYFPLTDPTPVWKKNLAEKATKIIAISENTKEDIVKYYGINEDMIEVIYLGNSLRASGGKPDDDVVKRLPKRFILFVGSRKIYKNFYFFVRAVAPILQKEEDLNLVCIGGGQFSDDEHAYFRSFNLDKKISQYTVNDDTLAATYEKAIAFVYPSLYEGFGLPVLEAFSCSCPAILSNTSSLPEVAGDAAAYFNPKDIESMRDTISRTIYDEERLENLKLRGMNRLKKFSWDDCAERTISLYKSLL